MKHPFLEASIRTSRAAPHCLTTALEAHFTGTMLPHFLLLLTLLGPGSTLRLWGNADTAAPAPLPARGRRQVPPEDYDEDYPLEVTDPPETLHNHTRSAAADPQRLTTLGTLEQRASAGPGTPKPTTVEATTGPSTGLGAGGTVVEELSTGQATTWMLDRVKLPTVLTTKGAPATEGALPVEAIGREDLSTGPAGTEAETALPVTTDAETTLPAATEAQTTLPAATEAETTPPVATDVQTTDAETSPPAATGVVFMGSVTMVTVSTEPLAVKPLSRGPPTPTFPVTYKGTIATISNLPDSTLKSSEVVFPGSSATPSPTGPSDLIPVKQCLLAILVLALVATVFLVCTVVLAVRLSRKSHMYPVRNYSPTEMVCISALLPDAGEGAPTAANGGLAMSQGLKAEAEAGEDHEGDDLTLRSFLP